MKFNCHTCDSKIKTTVDDHHGPTIGICGHTGATWDTLHTLLSSHSDIDWHVCVYTTNRRPIWGFYDSAQSTDSMVHLRVEHGPRGDLDPEDIYWDLISWEDIVHIQIG